MNNGTILREGYKRSFFFSFEALDVHRPPAILQSLPIVHNGVAIRQSKVQQTAQWVFYDQVPRILDDKDIARIPHMYGEDPYHFWE